MPTSALDPIRIDDFSSGLIRNTSPFKMPDNATPYAVNFHFDEKAGEATLRKGTSMMAGQIVDNYPVLGLANFRSRSTSNHALLAVVSDGTNNDVYKYATPWAKSLEDDTKDLKTRFCQFLDSIVRVNGTDACKSFNGTTWATSAGVFDLTNMPKGMYVANYKDRVHVIGEDGILYSSSVPKFYLAYDAQTANFNVGATLTGGTSGAKATIVSDTDAGTTGTLVLTDVIGVFQNNETITDSVGGSATADGAGAWQISWRSGYITTPIDPDNGFKGKATGFGVVGGLLFIFFERAFYTWNGSSTTPDAIADIGCSSQESVAGSGGYLFFANKDGVYMTQGGFPQKISHWVQDFFDNMSSANYQHIAGGCDGKHYYCSIGNVTIDGVAIPNVVLRYSIQTQEWAVYSYPTQPRVFSQYISTNDVQLLYGDNDGNVIQIDSSANNDSYASSTASIDYELHTKDFFNPIRGMKKSITKNCYIHSEESSGAKLYYRVDSDQNRWEGWKLIGEIKSDNQELPIDTINYKWVRFKIAGVSSTGRLSVKGLEFPNNNLHG